MVIEHSRQKFHSSWELKMGWKNVNPVIENKLYLGKYVNPIHPVVTMLICFLPSISAARSSRSLSERRITHILSVCPDPIPGELPESGMTHLRIPVEDVDHADLLIYLPTAVRFIDQAMRSHGIVLVHCVQGLSRSATVVAAYCKFNTPTLNFLNLIFRFFSSNVGPADKFHASLRDC
jgi:dual specificity phosphatase 12